MSVNVCLGVGIIDEGTGLRVVEGLVIPKVGAVVRGSGRGAPWRLIDIDGADVPAAHRWLTELHANGNPSTTLRAYAYDLLSWLRFLNVVEVGWKMAARAEVRDWVRWHLDNPNQQRRRGSGVNGRRPDPGAVNEKTGKPYLEDSYARATINRQLSAISGFYDFAIDADLGPLINPVPRSRAELTRVYAHASPMEPKSRKMRAPYRQKMTKRMPRAISDTLYEDVFSALTCNRDRAIVATAVSSGMRASELLSMRRGLLNAATHTAEIIPKGGGTERVLVRISPSAFVWIARYLAERPPGPAGEPVWMTRRGKTRPLTYWALRRILERTNEVIGSNVTLHDFRHTFCMRLAADENLTVAEMQELMRHASLDATMVYLRANPEDLIAKLHEHWNRPPAPPPTAAPGYAAEDLRVLFGESD
jgi:integrase/recombinase XerC